MRFTGGTCAKLWAGFLGALVFNREILNHIWKSFRGLNIVLQVIIGLLTLPVIVGLWVWNTRLPAWLRAVIVVALAWVTIYTFFPRFTLA
jgi:hypothetical protein